MTTIDTERSSRGRRAFADVMTFAAPDDSTPANAESASTSSSPRSGTDQD